MVNNCISMNGYKKGIAISSSIIALILLIEFLCLSLFTNYYDHVLKGRYSIFTIFVTSSFYFLTGIFCAISIKKPKPTGFIAIFMIINSAAVMITQIINLLLSKPESLVSYLKSNEINFIIYVILLTTSSIMYLIAIDRHDIKGVYIALISVILFSIIIFYTMVSLVYNYVYSKRDVSFLELFLYFVMNLTMNAGSCIVLLLLSFGAYYRNKAYIRVIN